MAKLSNKLSEVNEILKQGENANNAIKEMVKGNSPRQIREFAGICEEKFVSLFRNFPNREKYLSEVSKIMNYFEKLSSSNQDNNFDIMEQSPEIQILFLKSVNEAYKEFKKRHDL